MGESSITNSAALGQVDSLKAQLITHATGEQVAGGNDAYIELRRALREQPDTYGQLPQFVRHCGDLGEFWDFIKDVSSTYAGRRKYIREAFAPLIAYLEEYEPSLVAVNVTDTLSELDSTAVDQVWTKALHRRRHDPEGAITAARTMLETVYKHILDDRTVPYGKNDDLPKLWALAAAQLNLTPGQHEATDIRAILGNCQAVVGGIANLRNAVGDAHGQGRRPVRARPKHAALAVNLAGAMASFLVASWQEQNDVSDS
jgi:hypothetical protein